MVEEVERDRLVGANEELVILAKAPRTIRDAYLLVADLGIRPDDAVRLTWEDVDFTTGDIFIAGGKTGKKAQRYASMSKRIKVALMERAKRNEKTNSKWVFPSTKRVRIGEHMTSTSISSRFSKFKKKVGFPKDLVLYSARHTFATDVTEATGDITKTQKALGHTSLRTTTRYNHSRGANIAEIMDTRNSHNMFLDTVTKRCSDPRRVND